MEVVSLKPASLLPDLAYPGPPISRRGTHEALRAGFWGLKQPTFYIYEMAIPVRRRLHVKESKWTEPTVQVWPQNVFLSKYLEMQAAREGPEYFRDKSVLELGAGCGLTGMVAAMLGASVTVVEGAALFHHLRHNVDMFSAEWKNELQIRCEEESAALGKVRSGKSQTKNPPFDLIICNDVSSEKDLQYSFLLTLLELMGEKSEVLLCHTRSRSPDALAAAADNDHGRFMFRLSEIFEVEEVESEDTIRAFCEQLAGGAQLLRSQSTIDIQECSDAEGRLIILRLRCSRDIEELRDYVHKQLEKESALQHKRDGLKLGVCTSPERSSNIPGPEPASVGKKGTPGETRANEPPTTTDRLLSEPDRVTCEEAHISTTSLRRSSHKRTLSGARDLRHEDTAAAGWTRHRILRPRTTAGTKRESSPSNGGVPLGSRTGSSSVASGGRVPSAERCAAADDGQKPGTDARLSPRTREPSAAQPRIVAAAKKVPEHLDAPRTSFTQGKAASPSNGRSAEKLQPVLPVSDKVRAAVVSAPRLSASSSATRMRLTSNHNKTPTQGSPSSGLRSRTLTSTSKDKGGIAYPLKRGKPESMNSLRPKGSSSTETQPQQVRSGSCTITAKECSSQSSPMPPSCSPSDSRSQSSSVSPPLRQLLDASRLLSRRGHSAAPKGTTAQISAAPASSKNPASPLSTAEPAHSLTSGSKMLKSVYAQGGPQRPVTSKTVSMENRSCSPTTVPRAQQSQQFSGETLGVGKASKEVLASSSQPAKSRTALQSAQRDLLPSEKRATRRLSSTSRRTGGSPLVRGGNS